MFGSTSKGWPGGVTRWLRQYRLPLRNRHFWIAQALVVGIALAHALLENLGLSEHLGRLYFVPISLFFVPIIYAALNFGAAGSVSTALWVAVISIPNLAIWHAGVERLGEVFQLAVLVSVAAFLGHRVDSERRSRTRAEAAGAALKAYAAHVVGAQEEERQRVARELHDDTIQTLSLLCRKLDSASVAGQSLPPAVTRELEEARRITEDAVRGLRDFARALRPPILEDLGVVPSIRRLLVDFTGRTGIKGQLKLDGQERRLPEVVELGLFRIAQEALRNVEYHSKATEALVTLTFADRRVTLVVSDNGVGFTVPVTPETLSASPSQLGLLGMHERAELLGGSIDLQSVPGKGTVIATTIPLP